MDKIQGHTPGRMECRLYVRGTVKEGGHSPTLGIDGVHIATIHGEKWDSNGITASEAAIKNAIEIAHRWNAYPDLLEVLHAAVLRVELANSEGDMILSAWLPDARAALAKARGE